MKKKITVLITLLCVLVILISNVSYGICNTVRFTKKLTAVRLTLSDGRVLYDLKLGEDMAIIDAKAYKNLYLAFVLNSNCEEYELEDIKTLINGVIDKLYETYEEIYQEKAENYINISIRLYDGKEPNVNKDGRNIVGGEKDKDAIKSIVNNITSEENNVYLTTAVEKTTSFFPYISETRDDVLKMLIFITNGNLEISENGKNKLKTIIKDYEDSVMAFIRNINIHTGNNEFPAREFYGGGYSYAEITAGNIANSETDNIVEILKRDLLTNGDLDPASMKYPGVQILPNVVCLICDNEILHGATLKAEYEINISKTAAFGDGTVEECKVTDTPDSKFFYSPEEHLLTDKSKTNGDYGWRKREDGKLVVEDCEGRPQRLVLSSIISRDMEDLIYENFAECYIRYNVQAETNETRAATLKATASKIKVIPPTGNNNTTYICALIILGFITTICIVVKKQKRKNNL